MISDQQQRVEQWVIKCFGEKILLNKEERIRRFIEESLELAQAAGLTIQDIADIGNYVYSRKAGEIYQEVGGCGVTLLSVGAAFNIDVLQELERELVRIESFDPDHFRKRHKEKHDAGICADEGDENVEGREARVPAAQ